MRIPRPSQIAQVEVEVTHGKMGGKPVRIFIRSIIVKSILLFVNLIRVWNILQFLNWVAAFQTGVE